MKTGKEGVAFEIHGMNGFFEVILMPICGYWQCPSDWRIALKLVDSVIDREPTNSMAFAIKAVAHLVEVLSSLRPVPPQDGEAASAAARRAVELNEHSDFAHHARAMVHLFYKRDLDAAKRECERALELNPYYPFAMAVLGLILYRPSIYADGIKRVRLHQNTAAGNEAERWFEAIDTVERCRTDNRATGLAQCKLSVSMLVGLGAKVSFCVALSMSALGRSKRCSA